MDKLEFDSQEENHFYWWLIELQQAGYVKDIEMQPKSFKLSESLWGLYEDHLKTKVNTKNEELIKGHIYKTDFYIEWEEKSLGIFTTPPDSMIRKKKKSSLQFILCDAKENPELTYYSYVEIKGTFDRNNMTRLVTINQKWVWDKYGEFINIVIPLKHFNKTFTPNRYLFTEKSGKLRKIDPKQLEVRSLEKFTGRK